MSGNDAFSSSGTAPPALVPSGGQAHGGGAREKLAALGPGSPRDAEGGPVMASGKWLLAVSRNDGGQSELDGEESGRTIAEDVQGRRSGRVEVKEGSVGQTTEESRGLPASVAGAIGRPGKTFTGAPNDIISGQVHGGGVRKKLSPRGTGSGRQTSGGSRGGPSGGESRPKPSGAVSQEKRSMFPEESTLLGAIRSGQPEAVSEVLERMDQAQATRELLDPNLIALAARVGDCQLFESILAAMLETVTTCEVSERVCGLEVNKKRGAVGEKWLTSQIVHQRGVVSSRALAMYRMTSRLASSPASQVARLLAEAFSVATTEAQGVRHTIEDPLRGLSMLLQHGTKPHPTDLVILCRAIDYEELDECLFQAVASAKNSFIPSLNLSFAFRDAIRSAASERDRRVLARLQHDVDSILTETLNRLPQSVCGLSGGMAACTALLEPEVADDSSTYGERGPLARALGCTHRIVTFATTPLCMNFMLLKFTRGLPALKDGHSVLILEKSRLDIREEAKGHESLTALCPGSILGGFLPRVGKLLWDDDRLAPLTFFPGAHFIATGVVALPNSYYKVPLMRMALEAMIFTAALAFFTSRVLLFEKGQLTIAEVAFAIYVVAAIMLEATEMWKDLAGYLLDRWKAPHFLALVVALAAFLARAIDPDSSWGRGLYAVGSPLMYWRLLYYAQVIPSQGSTIQVLYGMASELGQFFVVMGVVILGFAMSFFALFRDVKGETIRGALLDAFQAMLGEVGLFDDFVGEKHDLAATVLLVSYLVVMTIMLLNLLIAVLSTAHGKVEEAVLIRVSRARVYTHYRWVVATDALPAPFNLAQLVVLLPCKMVDVLFKGNTYPIARRGVGRIVFWLLLGPGAILGGVFVWLVSTPKALFAIWGKRSLSIASRLGRTMLCLLWITLGVPLCLVVSWVTQATRVLFGRTFGLEGARSSGPIIYTVDDMLREVTGVGMAALRMHLKNPVASEKCYVSARVEDRLATVDLQALRFHVEDMAKEHIEAAHRRLEKQLDEKLEGFLAKLSAT
ncbi:Transient Receptor Potential Channel [Ectocarpus siliculosus]|uniref:Transient Receptor Potential Channel n=1 Tax=Ectocarpus siliculosus TaxID=2880 RepID=D7FR83_ECTSI|nr:Transient Receptor Potential Channel [Ectocarpus siliculosus]|eukprot:CBJ49208.1 Transient Receptor Potential Channel [Ectocarpus siliculosus]